MNGTIHPKIGKLVRILYDSDSPPAIVLGVTRLRNERGESYEFITVLKADGSQAQIHGSFYEVLD